MRNRGILLLLAIALSTHLYVSTFSNWCMINNGVAFGMNIPLWPVVLAFLAVLWLAIKERKEALLWAIVLASALNLLDRSVHGGVCDYIRIGTFPIFNLNDCIIVVSIFLLMIKQWTELRNTK